MIINYIYDFIKNHNNYCYRQKEFIDIGVDMIIIIVSILSACLSWSKTEGSITYKLFNAFIAYMLNIFYIIYYFIYYCIIKKD
jgi:hypothetical protein